MSDESEVTPLRLKRSVPATPPSVPPIADASEQLAEPAVSPDKLRKRPSLAVEVPASEATSVAPTGQSGQQQAQSADASAAAPASALKLRIGVRPPPPVESVNTPPPFDPADLPGIVHPESSVPPSVDPATHASAPPLMPLPSLVPTVGGPTAFRPEVPAMGFGGSTLTPLSPLAPPTGVGPLPPLAAPAGLSAKTGLSGSLHTSSAVPSVKPHHPRRDLLIFMLLLVLVCAAAFWGYRKLYGDADSASSPPAPAPVASTPNALAPAVPANNERVASNPSAALKDAVDSSKAVEQASPIPASSEGPNESPAVEPRTENSETADVQRPVTPSQPTPRFRRYADNLRVSGVFQGANPRALIDGRVVRVGEVLDAAAGIRFVGLDAAKRELILEENGGAVLRVKY